MKKVDILRKREDRHKNTFQPEFLRLGDKEERERFEQLLEDEAVYVHDEMYDQLKELIKSRNPTKPLDAAEYETLISAHTGGMDMHEYGVWVYYPWNRRLVHILDEKEFIEVRTSRNQYKITNVERDLLATKKIGVIGLSVGQSVSVTLAMERGCGELRLADFDVLELTNYNRIRTGLHNLGIKKVVAVAREIMEIDPYLTVKCYEEGITEESIDSFIYGESGKLDLLIDECDSVDIKILCRLKAKEAQIPVLMEASDRGTIDVERFDLEPSRPILHGNVAHLDLGKLKHLKSYEEKVPYILPIAGTDTLSNRMKASMLEIGRTITTWPQLASAVALGGGITADVSRRILLDEYHESGRYFIDIEQLIADKKPVTEEQPADKEISEAEMDVLIEKAGLPKNDENLPVTSIKEIVNAGIMAPTKGNSQPWKWKYNNGILYLFCSGSRDGTKKKMAFIGLGAAVENIVLKAHELGFEVQTIPFAAGKVSELVCAFKFTGKHEAGTEDHVADNLSAVINERRTNRLVLEKKPIEEHQLNSLSQIAETVPGAKVQFVNTGDDLAALTELIAKAERIRLLDEQGNTDFVNELNWKENGQGRGIDLSSLYLRPSEQVAYSMVKSRAVINYLNKWDAGYGLEWFARKYAVSASAIGLLTINNNEPEAYCTGGRAMQRMWLTATKQGLAFQPLNTLIGLFDELQNSGKNRFAKKVADELQEMRKSYEKIFSLNDNLTEVMLFRTFVSDQPAERSKRLPLESVLLMD